MLASLYKEVRHSMGIEKVGNRVPRFLARLLEPPKRKGVLKINKYGNAKFVMITLERSFYEEFEKNSLELKAPPEHSAVKALEEYHGKIKRGITLKKAQA